MAHVFAKGEKLAAVALGLLRRTQKGAALFKTRYGKADFKDAEGDVINVKRPAVLRARDKGWRNDNAIIFDRILQSKIQIKLDRHPYSALELQPEEYTLDIESYATTVTSPQVDALVDWYEDLIVGGLRAADFVHEVTFDPNAGEATAAAAKKSDPRKVASRARKLFQDSHVPSAGRYWLVGSTVAEAIRDYGKLLDVDTSGLPEAVREGVVTKLSGFIVVELDALGENESYFVHESAVAVASVAPDVPPVGVAGGGAAAANGIGLTQLWAYDGSHLKLQSIVHSFAGSTVVTDPEVDADGIVLLDDDGEVRFEFVRAVKVVFVAVGETDTGNGSAAYTVAVTGSPTGGTFTLTVDGEVTDPIAHNATNADIASALNEIEGVAGAKVTGTTTKTVKFNERVVMTGTASLTGGTTPNVTVTAV